MDSNVTYICGTTSDSSAWISPSILSAVIGLTPAEFAE